ncbi:hypothetical protein H7849_11745 [Alloacidobacterium dinghuense]|uniref:Uncharacterized protein n=1 Tax=Alloacidobacterium dinghuense TaxID=2763107 RepID=A0A7G8BPM8_9BACT|nr:hypothetical protein [Alloacidobacterium dinghuense]QNI34498.1 hypothetical protein H7849_11745 [Alloacidobacterium dinghuense]
MLCAKCAGETVQAKDGLCRGCRLRTYQVIRYPWTSQMDDQLRQAYRIARNKTQLSRELTRLSNTFSYPRHVLNQRAQKMRLILLMPRKWSDEEIEQARGLAGEMPLRKMAKVMRRSPYAIKCKLHTLGIGVQVLDGYSTRLLGELLGVHHNRISTWIARGWLVVREGRITEASVQRFLWDHMDEYRFRLADEAWLKGMLNPSIGTLTIRPKKEEAA